MNNTSATVFGFLPKINGSTDTEIINLFKGKFKYISDSLNYNNKKPKPVVPDFPVIANGKRYLAVESSWKDRIYCWFLPQ